MRMLIGVGLMLVVTCGQTTAAEPIDAKKLIGTWEQPGDKAKKRMKTVLELLPGEKAKLTLGEKAEFTYDYTLTIEPNQFLLTHKGKDGTNTRTFKVTKLNEEVLEAQEENGDKYSFKRVVAKKTDR